VAPIEGSPAEQAGIRSGDRIVSVDDVDVTAHPFERVARRMRGLPGTKVKLGIVRPGESRPLSFDIVRAEIHVPSVASKLLAGNIGYVRLKQFQEGTADEFVVHVGRLRDAAAAKGKSPLAGVLIDMRANPGGFVDEATAIADECLTDGVIYTTRGRGKVLEEARAEPGGALVDMPIVIVVNEWTASASELLAGALRDHGRALLVGAPTFGKGSVQAVMTLPFGAGLKLTVARYYTPRGVAIQARGLEPDLFVRGALDPTVKREGDLEGHLAGEGKSVRPNGPHGKGPQVIDARKVDDMPLVADIHAIADDPRKGKDLVLNTAYQTLTDVVIPRWKRAN
jgi:carboxyl-terminal processing protease